MYIFLLKVHVMQQITFPEVNVKRTVIDRLGPVILSTLRTKGQVLHRLRAHFAVPGLSSDLSTCATGKFPMFLSRLNEISEAATPPGKAVTIY